MEHPTTPPPMMTVVLLLLLLLLLVLFIVVLMIEICGKCVGSMAEYWSNECVRRGEDASNARGGGERVKCEVRDGSLVK